MKMGKKTDYAMRLLIQLSKEETLEISTVANKELISTEYLRKVGQELVKLGIVTSRKGYRGGFSLAKKPEEIDLYELILQIEQIDMEKPVLLQCAGCQCSSYCKFSALTLNAQQNFFKSYIGYTLQDIL